MYICPVLQRIKGSATLSQAIPNTRSTPCKRLVTVRFVLIVKPDVTTGTSTARPRDNTFFPSPNSRKVLCDCTVSPHCVTPAGEIKFLVAPLSINARISRPKIRAGTTSKVSHPLQIEEWVAGFQKRLRSTESAAPEALHCLFPLQCLPFSVQRTASPAKH